MSSREQIDETFSAILSHMVRLQSRVDALTGIVELLALRQGSTRAQFRSAIKSLTDSCVQKRLEKIEDLSPGMAAKIDHREDIPEIDPEILGYLRFDDETRSD
jgi:hypothetical protein